VAWKLALENTNSPTALLLSRQNIKDLPLQNGSDHYTRALQCARGAYIVMQTGIRPDLLLLGNGSEVATLVEGARLLNDKNQIRVQVVSAISEGLFRNQDLSYQDKVIPPGIPVLGLTAGLPVTLRGLTGDKGLIIGLESFGFSAPFEVLDEKLGFTAENVYNQALKYLKDFSKKK
jgi:transketolase